MSSSQSLYITFNGNSFWQNLLNIFFASLFLSWICLNQTSIPHNNLSSNTLRFECLLYYLAFSVERTTYELSYWINSLLTQPSRVQLCDLGSAVQIFCRSFLAHSCSTVKSGWPGSQMDSIICLMILRPSVYQHNVGTVNCIWAHQWLTSAFTSLLKHPIKYSTRHLIDYNIYLPLSTLILPKPSEQLSDIIISSPLWTQHGVGFCLGMQ